MPLYIPERGKIFFCKGISRAAYGMESFDAAENMSISCSEAMEKYFSSRNIKIKPEIKSSYEKTDSQGYCLTSWAESENTIIGASEMGDKKDLPEEIGKNVAQNLEKFLDSGATLDSNSADQVLPFMALAKGSEIKIAEMTGHIETSIALTEKFLKMKFKIEKENDGIRISC
jgi:RNA 3'-terminal phosphate cyclase